MTNEDFRALALALPDATESSHRGHPDFHVRNKIFATLWPEQNRGMVKLHPEQQGLLAQAEPGSFTPVPGGWGARGATHVHLAAADAASVANALAMARANVLAARR